MSKYKVGDKVRVRTDFTSSKKYCISTSVSMNKHVGDILTIRCVNPHSYKVNENNWSWTDDMLEPVTTTTNKYLDRPIRVGDLVERIKVTECSDAQLVRKGNIYKVINKNSKALELEGIAKGLYWDSNAFKPIQPPQSKPIPKKRQPMQQKQKEKKLKIFLKDGSINIKGIMYQLAKKDQTETHLPFVNKAIADELTRVKRAIRDITPKAINYNIKLAATLESFKEASKVKHVMTPADAVMFYEYEKAHGSFDWIKKYLTSKNVTSTTPVGLFKSNNRHIYICEGILYLEERDLVFAATIKFDKKTKQFYL